LQGESTGAVPRTVRERSGCDFYDLPLVQKARILRLTLTLTVLKLPHSTFPKPPPDPNGAVIDTKSHRDSIGTVSESLRARTHLDFCVLSSYPSHHHVDSSYLHGKRDVHTTHVPETHSHRTDPISHMSDRCHMLKRHPSHILTSMLRPSRASKRSGERGRVSKNLIGTKPQGIPN